MMRCVMLFALLSSLASPLLAQSPQEEVAKIAKEARLRLNFYESKNFIWGFSGARTKLMPAIKAAEKGFVLWLKIAKLKDYKAMWGRKKALMVILRNRREYKKFAEWYGKTYHPYKGFTKVATGNAYWPQPYPRVCAFAHYNPLTEEMMVNAAVHLVGHLCMHRYQFHHNFIPPWLEEGFGLYLESRVLKKSICFCFGGKSAGEYGSNAKLSELPFLKWKQSVRGLVRRGLMRRMEMILPLRMSQIGPKEAAKSRSMIEFMIHEDPQKFCKFVKLMKSYWPHTYEYEFTKGRGAAQAKALKEAYGWSWEQLDQAWKNYVLKAYR